MNFFRKNLPTNRRSQIAVIITFVIAVIFLFIAVFINLAKVSQTKTTTSTAADKAALSLASQLGSISHYYKEKVLKGGTEKTTTDGKKVIEICGSGWIALGIIVLATAVIALFLVPLPFLSASVLLSGATFTAYLSTSMLGGIDNKFNEMTLYNSLRERALFQALISTQSDDVEYKAKTKGSGIFYEDSNGNGAFDPGEAEYDLRDIPEMLNAKKVSRFLAWYYTKRLPLVSDDGLKLALDKFLNGTPMLPVGLKSFTDTDEWSETEWKIKKLSYVIKPGSGSSDYDVTCTSTAPCSSGDTACTQCPDWVKDKTTEQLRIARIDVSDDAYGGFLKDKLISLLDRLEDKYSGTFCSGEGCKIKPDDVDNLIGDLRRFLAGCKDLFNLPVSERLRNITQWFPIFYDFTRHKPDDKTSIDGKDDYDIYLRLARDQNKITAWIRELEALNNNTIVQDIKDSHGQCSKGQGDFAGRIEFFGCYSGPNCFSCRSPECDWESVSSGDCEETGSFTQFNCGTCYYKNCSACIWKGTFYTCCNQPLPVCTGQGDLYGSKPGWCDISLSKRKDCSKDGPKVKTIYDCGGNGKYFQGQLSWRTSPPSGQFDSTSGPTEVEQAIRILRALKDDLTRTQRIIGDLANAIAKQFPSDEPYTDLNGSRTYDVGEPFTDWNGNRTYDASLPESRKRNEIVYAWQDKSQFSHLVSAEIDNYPTELPHVTENSTWDRIKETCRTLESYTGDFTITTSRYDQDQPTDIAGWKLRRGKKEFETDTFIRLLNGIVADIQDNAQIDIDTTQPMVNEILNNYAITSVATAHYGPKKSDIKITRTEGDD